MSEDLSRLRWRCRRGMLELDLLLQPFLESGYGELNEAEQGHFLQLLELPDQELFEQLMEIKQPEEKELSHVITKIRHAATTQG
ncbi:MAG: succinate dehydrogenase assembly factor 2 [Chromatiales bacterium]|nr:succinate dehydrogenase assembly factor 2 [Chromatiales bacterium]